MTFFWTNKLSFSIKTQTQNMTTIGMTCAYNAFHNYTTQKSYNNTANLCSTSSIWQPSFPKKKRRQGRDAWSGLLTYSAAC